MELDEATAIAVRQIEDAMFKAPVTPWPEADCQLDVSGITDTGVGNLTVTIAMVHHVEPEDPA